MSNGIGFLITLLRTRCKFTPLLEQFFVYKLQNAF